jgi:hypothetical protein
MMMMIIIIIIIITVKSQWHNYAAHTRTLHFQNDTQNTCSVLSTSVYISPENKLWRPRGGTDVQLYSFFNLGARWGWVFDTTPRPFDHRENSVPTVQKAGWAPAPVWTKAENLAPPQGFDPRTVQSVASRYTDWAVTVHTSANRELSKFLPPRATNFENGYPLPPHQHLI